MSKGENIHSVYVLDNGMLAVFNQHGQQMPDYQGPLSEMATKLLKDAPLHTQWFIGERGKSANRVSKDYIANIHRALEAT